MLSRVMLRARPPPKSAFVLARRGRNYEAFRSKWCMLMPPIDVAWTTRVSNVLHPPEEYNIQGDQHSDQESGSESSGEATDFWEQCIGDTSAPPLPSGTSTPETASQSSKPHATGRPPSPVVSTQCSSPFPLEKSSTPRFSLTNHNVELWFSVVNAAYAPMFSGFFP